MMLIITYVYTIAGEYHFANMTAGDCLYIPFKWIHQVRSYNQNIAVNLWWDHAGTKALDLDKCHVSHVMTGPN